MAEVLRSSLEHAFMLLGAGSALVIGVLLLAVEIRLARFRAAEHLARKLMRETDRSAALEAAKAATVEAQSWERVEHQSIVTQMGGRIDQLRDDLLSAFNSDAKARRSFEELEMEQMAVHTATLQNHEERITALEGPRHRSATGDDG